VLDDRYCVKSRRWRDGTRNQPLALQRVFPSVSIVQQPLFME
jgi:uncharacterized membrane protein YhaH (DUF805 family)